MEEDNTQYFCDEWNNMRPSDFMEKYHKILNHSYKCKICGKYHLKDI